MSNKKMSPTVFSDFVQGHRRGKGITLPARGISHVNNIQKKISYIEEGDTVIFEKVNDNKYDPNAVRIIVIANTPKGKRKINVGWMPSEINGNYRFEVSRGCEFFAEVSWVFEGEFHKSGDMKKSPGLRIKIYDFDEPEEDDDDDLTDGFIPKDSEPPF